MNFAHSYRRRSNCSGSGWGRTLIGRLLSGWLAIVLLGGMASAVNAAPMLSSNPLARNVLFLDCSTWDASDDAIAQTWLIVAQVYARIGVDLNVTTANPGDRPNVAWLRMGGPLQQPGNVAGWAVIGNWTFGTLYQQYGDAFAGHVFADGLNDSPLECGEAAAHETGHLFGLPHEDSGIMFPTIVVDPFPTWTAYDVAFLDDKLGVWQGEEIVPVIAEPHLLALILLALALIQRRRRQPHHRPASSGTRRTDTTVHGSTAARAASESFASTKRSNSISFSPAPSRRLQVMQNLTA